MVNKYIMKTRLLKKIKKLNPIYKRNNEYRYRCEIICDGGGWYIDTGWTTDLSAIKKRQRERILEMARIEYKPEKAII